MELINDLIDRHMGFSNPHSNSNMRIILIFIPDTFKWFKLT